MHETLFFSFFLSFSIKKRVEHYHVQKRCVDLLFVTEKDYNVVIFEKKNKSGRIYT